MKDGKQWVHFLGICGGGAAGIAGMMKRKGFYVTGSDQGAYPPMTDYLEKQEIEFNKIYEAENINGEMDLVVVAGNALHVDPNNSELSRARELGIKIISWPEILQEHVARDESVVVAGTYGKTTISTLLVKILTMAGLNPSYMIYMTTSDFENNCESTESNYSVLEGDEHPTLGYSDLPKFAYFPPKYMVLTSAMWDHFNIYHNEKAYIEVFKDAVRKLPKEGFLLAAKNGANLEEIAAGANCQVFWYEADENVKIDRGNGDMAMKIFLKIDKQVAQLQTRLFGRHNAENIIAAAVCAWKLKVPLKAIIDAVAGFGGIPARLELKANGKNWKLYHDVGQHPGKAKGAIEALRWRYPDSRITVVFDPQASVLHDRNSLIWYDNDFSQADEIIVTKISHRKTSGERVTGRAIVEAIKPTQSNVNYFPEDEIWLEKLRTLSKDRENIILVLASGGFRGLWKQLIDVLENS